MRRVRISFIKAVGYIFIGSVWASTIGLFCLILFEFSGAAAYLIGKVVSSEGKSIRETPYYGEPLKFDPYEKFKAQHLHPYYLFSLPWLDKDRKDANNKYVSVNEIGFRNSISNPNGVNVVLLGGSTAFGYYSSSDAKTIASQLSTNSPFNVVNRNAMAWNSHQELVALAKFNDPYSLSISFSGANDMVIFCKGGYRNAIKDQMGLFNQLQKFFNDEPSLSTMLKQKIANLFPSTFLLYSLYQNVKQPVLSSKEAKQEYCGGPKDEDILVETFLRNQKTMRQLSNARGASHWLVIQPIYSLHAKAKKAKADPEFWEARDFMRRVIKKILASEFCEKSCLDFSEFFNSNDADELLYDRTSSDSWKRALFVDELHLTDKGVAYVVDKLKQQLLPWLAGIRAR